MDEVREGRWNEGEYSEYELSRQKTNRVVIESKQFDEYRRNLRGGGPRMDEVRGGQG